MYKNEKEVGEGIRASGVPREEIFVSTVFLDVWEYLQRESRSRASSGLRITRALKRQSIKHSVCIGDFLWDAPLTTPTYRRPGSGLH
jgi:hypothetical protein